ncbi:MAG: MerR family DNA-binding transcriptional regulator [Hyphomicrobiales bacterium]|nr:MerR family DNA-binding transcriptional regulator [Hyphomicrobiales bacterium]MCP5373912.1 MerR family DNA-binding transcriptional regulator [Hyphomicrobiales bacterium]
MEPTYGIAELAREFDVTTRTIRFYEDKDLLRPRREGQRRVYTHRDRVRLRLIMRGKRLGFSLDEIHQMIDLYDEDPTEVAQLKLFISKIRERRAVLLQQKEDIVSILDELDALEAQSRDLLREKGKVSA